MAIVTVDRNVFSCFPAHGRIAIAPGRDRTPAPTDLIQGLWTERGEMSVSQDPGFVAEYASPGGRLAHETYLIHREHSAYP